MLHYALGDRLVRALTLASRAFFDDPPERFSDVPLGHRMPVLVHAREDEREALDALEARIAPFAELERLDEAGVHELCPLLKDDARPRHRRPQRHPPRPACAAAGQSAAAAATAAASSHTGARVARSSDTAGAWTVDDRAGRQLFGADPGQCGGLLGRRGRAAGRRRSRSASSRKRRTIITFDAPPGTDLDRPAVRQDGRRRALFRAGERAAVRLADGRGAERAVRRPARRI